MPVQYDIAICGAGPVGLTFALMLAKRGLPAERLLLIDAKPPSQSANDPRTLALSYGSKLLLESVGCWPLQADAIDDIHISRRGHFGRTLIDRADHGLPALGYVTRYGTLVAALNTLLERSGISAVRPAQLAAVKEDPEIVHLELADGRTLQASLLVQAEGGIFSEQQPKQRQRDYEQVALIAHVHCSAPHIGRAFERFTDEGPLALLPQENGYAMVWCMRPDSAIQLQALTDLEFAAALQRSFGNRVGVFTSISPRHSFRLGLNACANSSARTTMIGNASQTLHPVAGQGLNLGLRDAAVLARLLAEQPVAESFQRFAAARRNDRALTISLTDTMARVFTSLAPGIPLQPALGLALATLDMHAPAKSLLAEQLMFGLS